MYFVFPTERELNTKCVVEMEKNQTILNPSGSNLGKGDSRSVCLPVCVIITVLLHGARECKGECETHIAVIDSLVPSASLCYTSGHWWKSCELSSPEFHWCVRITLQRNGCQLSLDLHSGKHNIAETPGDWGEEEGETGRGRVRETGSERQ